MALTDDEVEELRESFEYNDLDHDGKIDFDEFINMLSELEARVDPDEAKIGFAAIDTDNDGAIELNEFIDWWRDK